MQGDLGFLDRLTAPAKKVTNAVQDAIFFKDDDDNKPSETTTPVVTTSSTTSAPSSSFSPTTIPTGDTGKDNTTEKDGRENFQGGCATGFMRTADGRCKPTF